MVFLIGGTGNQLFQFATAGDGDRFSGLFLRPWLCRLLGWTPHPRAFSFPPAPGWAVAAALPVLLADLALARLAGVSLFTDFDNRLSTCRPRLRRLVAFGYFQRRPLRRDLAPIRAALEGAPPGPPLPVLAIHVRGGDLMAAGRVASHRYGLLPDSYYRRVLARAAADGALQGLREAVIFTDDPARCRALMAGLGAGPETGPDVGRRPKGEVGAEAGAGAGAGAGAEAGPEAEAEAEAATGSHTDAAQGSDRGPATGTVTEAGTGPGLPLPWRIETCGVDEMMRRCLAAEVFVASNSTLAWWLITLRGPERTSYAPRPFHRRSPVRTQDWARSVRPHYPNPDAPPPAG